MPAQDIITSPWTGPLYAVAGANHQPSVLRISFRRWLWDGCVHLGVIYELLVNAAKYSAPDSMIHINAQQISATRSKSRWRTKAPRCRRVRQRCSRKFYRVRRSRRKTRIGWDSRLRAESWKHTEAASVWMRARAAPAGGAFTVAVRARSQCGRVNFMKP